jgi:RNA polymerase subunit RPABC4/transcription elongation factor Spt4
MFDDLIKPKTYKAKARYHACISCGRVLKTGEKCPDCNPSSGEQLKLWDDDELWSDWSR